MTPRYRVTLTAQERQELEALSRTVKTNAKQFLYARALLLCDRGSEGPAWTVAGTAEAMGVTPRTIEHLKKRFVEEGIEAALSRKKPDNPPREIIFGGVFERLPKLRVAFAHGGGSFPAIIGRLEHGFNCRPDLVAVDNDVNPRDYVAKADGTPARFFVDSLTHDAEVLRHLSKLVGSQRVALGTDYPFPLGEERPGQLIESMPDLSAAVKEQLLWETAMRFLGRSSAGQ